MQNVYHHYSNSTHTPRHRLGSAACGQQNGSSRPTAARRCQRYTSCLSAVPEGLDLIDSLFDSVVTTNDKGSAEAPAHVLATISQPTDTPSTTVAPAKAKQHAQQTSTITAPPAAKSQRSKLLQRLQKQRAKAGPIAVERAVPSPSTTAAPTSNSIPSQRSSTNNVKGDTLDDLVSLQQLLQNPVADVDDQSSSSSTRPSNPWLLRQQQQRKRQKQKQQQKEAAKYLAAQQQREQQQRQQEQQQQLQRQHLHAQLQQQQQQGPAADAVSNTSRARISTTRRVQLQHTPALQQTQQQHQESLPQQVDPHLQQDPNRGASVAASHHVQQPPKQQRQQQQPLLPQLQHQQQQVDIDLEGVVRSSRCRRPTSPLPQPPPPAAAAAAAAAPPSSAPKPKAASASRSSEDSASHSAGQQQGRQQSGQQQAAAAAAAGTPVPPAQPATTHPAAAAAAGTASESVQVPDIGSMPLLITGGLAAGDSVVWTQPAQIRTTAADAPAAAAAAALSKQATGTQKRSSSSSSRYRRGARSLQGIATGPKPDLPLSTAAAAAPASMSDSVTAANVTSSSTRIRTDTINHSNSSTNSSLAAVDMMDLQEKLKGLTKQNWQQLAQQHLQDLYDPTWHSSFYTLALDVWAAALPIKAANKSSSSSNSSSVAAAWAVSSLYCPEQCMWCSTLLALLDTLADDADLSRVEPAVQLLPAAVLRNLVLPAARLLDDELHQELLQADKRLGSSMSSRSSTPVTATKPLISPAPWLQEQQQQQQQDNEGKSNSSSSSSTPMVVTNASQDSIVRLGSSGKTLPPPPPPAAGAEPDVPPGAGCLLDTLLALQQLQGLYPGVELSALAHVAQLHGVWK